MHARFLADLPSHRKRKAWLCLAALMRCLSRVFLRGLQGTLDETLSRKDFGEAAIRGPLSPNG